MSEFRARIAGRFYAEFYFYLAVFIFALYFVAQPNRNPWLVVLAVISALFFVEMLYLMSKNLRQAQKAFVIVDKSKIEVADDKGTESLAWKDVDEVMIGWVSKDKWLEWLFGLEPSILVKKTKSTKGEVELGISPDYFPTQKILVEMQKLYPDKVRFA